MLIRTIGLSGVLWLAGLVGASGASAAGLANSPWPMFQHDPQHTGRSAFSAPTQLALSWRSQVHGMPGSPAIGADGTIYLPAGNDMDGQGSLYAFNPDGSQRWRYAFPAQENCVIVPTFTTPAVADDGTVYVHVQSGRTVDGGGHCTAGPSLLYAINPDGTRKWGYQLNFGAAVFSADNLSSPAIAPDGTIYLTARDTGFYAINPDGTLKWVVSPEATSISSSPAIASDGTIYFIIADLHAYTPAGGEKWTAEIGNAAPNSRSPSIGADGTIYACGISPNACHAVDPGGSVRWSFPIESQDSTTPAIANDGTVYLVGRGDSAGLFALGPEGGQRWRTLFDGSFSKVHHSPVVGADGELYARDDLEVGAGGFFGNLFAVNPDGTVADTETIPAVAPPGTGELSPAIGSDGTLYVPQPSGGTAGEYNPNDQHLAAYVQGAPPDGGGGFELTLGGPKRERLDRAVEVEVSCSSACSAEGDGKLVTIAKSGKLALAEKRRKFGLEDDSAQLGAGETATLKLRVPRRGKRIGTNVLRADGKAVADVEVSAVDAVGDEASAERKVKLRRR